MARSGQWSVEPAARQAGRPLECPGDGQGGSEAGRDAEEPGIAGEALPEQFEERRGQGGRGHHDLRARAEQRGVADEGRDHAQVGVGVDGGDGQGSPRRYATRGRGEEQCVEGGGPLPVGQVRHAQDLGDDVRSAQRAIVVGDGVDTLQAFEGTLDVSPTEVEEAVEVTRDEALLRRRLSEQRQPLLGLLEAFESHECLEPVSERRPPVALGRVEVDDRADSSRERLDCAPPTCRTGRGSPDWRRAPPGLDRPAPPCLPRRRGCCGRSCRARRPRHRCSRCGAGVRG